MLKPAKLVTLFVALLAAHSPADTLKLSSGREIECVVLSETNDQITVRRGYGVIGYPRAMVAEVKRSRVITAAASASPTPAGKAGDTRTNGSAGRFPAWSNVVGYLVAQPWGKDLRQIPATYVDNGVQKDVPYQSFACSSDYEVNIYGDPDDPACIEIGIYRGLINDAAAKTRCVEMIASLLPNAADAAIARALNLQRDVVERDGLTIEITPPDAPDAYGGWWVSVYDEDKLDKARASRAELDQVTVAAPLVKPAAVAAARPATPTPPPAPPAAAVPTPRSAYTGDDSDYDWTAAELAARRVRASSTSVASSAGGRVYVRGYTRKDGTYVRPHTRRR